MTPLRILVATDQWYPDLLGGVARVATETSRRWARAGHEVTVIAPAHVGEPERTILEDGALELLRVLPRGRLPQTVADPLFVRRRASSIADRGFDVAVAHTPTTAFGVSSSRLGVPLAYVFHADAAAESRFLRRVVPFGREWLAAVAFERPLRLLERRMLRAAAGVVVLSEYSRSLVFELAPAAAANAVRVGGAVDTDAFHPEGREQARAQLGVEASATLVLTVRRLVPRMGLEDLLGAAALLDDVPRLEVAIVGAGSLEDELRRRLASLALGDRVRLVGRVPDEALQLWYRAADLFVLPTVAHEGFGLVTAEALACGTPVVGTPVAATPELLRPLDPRLLTDGVGPAALADGVRRGLALATTAFRDSCRRYALEHLSWAAVMPAWEAVVRDVARTGRRHPQHRRATGGHGS
jgi:glycosyltransferase involved in cell wall biosynthesis